MSTTSETLNLPEARVEHWDALFDSEPVRAALRSYLLSRRWYRSKARNVTGIQIADVVPLAGTDSSIVIAAVEYGEGDCDNYLLTVRVAPDVGDRAHRIAHIVTSDGSGWLSEAVGDPALSDSLLSGIADEKAFPGRHGELTMCHTTAFRRIVGASHAGLEAKVSKAEQSNTSIIFGDRFI